MDGGIGYLSEGSTTKELAINTDNQPVPEEELALRFESETWPKREEMLTQLVGSALEDARTEEQLLFEIAKLESGDSQESSFPRYEIMNEIKHQLMLIWETLEWLQSEKLTGTRVAILLNSNYSIFYSFWNLCGKLINEIHDMEFDFESHGPSLKKVLETANSRGIESRLTKLIQRYRFENGRVQSLIQSNRDTHNHKDMLAFSNIDRLKRVSIEETQLRIDYSSRMKLSEDQAFTLQREGFFELREFMNHLITLFDKELLKTLSK